VPLTTTLHAQHLHFLSIIFNAPAANTAIIDASNSSSPAPSSTSILAEKWQQQPSKHLSNQNVRETLILEREHFATFQAAIGQSNWSTGQLINTGQMVKTAKMVK